MSPISRPLARRSGGFTLIELAIVIVIVGVLISVVAPKFKGGGNEAKATALYEFATSAVSNWRLVSMKCGTSTDVTASLLPSSASALNALNAIISGTNINAAYAGCFNDAQLAPLRAKVQGNTTDGFTVQSSGVTWTGGAANGAITVQFTNVLSDYALILYKKYSSVSGASSASTFPTTADTTDPTIQFTATSAGAAVATLSIIIN